MVSHNTGFIRTFSKFTGIVATTILLFSFAGCKNFFNTQDLFAHLEDSVSYENAQQCSFTLKADSGTGSFASGGNKTCKVGFDYSVQFNLNTEDYVLNHWGVFNPDDMSEIPNVLDVTTISNEEEIARGLYKVNLKFLRLYTNVIVKPVCYAIPKIVNINTRDQKRSEGFTQDTDIVIQFNKPIPQDLFIDSNGNAKNIEITCNNVDLLLSTQPKVSEEDDAEIIDNVEYHHFFLQPNLSADGKTLTIATNKCRHILMSAADQTNENKSIYFSKDDYADILVKIKPLENSPVATDAVEGEKIPFNSNVEWFYKISNKFDGTPPSVLEYDFYKMGNPDGFKDFIGKYPKTANLETFEDEINKEEYVKNRLYVTKSFTTTDNAGNKIEKDFAMFFSFKVQDNGGISSVESTYAFTDAAGGFNSNWSNKITIPNDQLQITKLSDDTYEVKGCLDADKLFDIPKLPSVYYIGIVFKDYSGNPSTVAYVPVVYTPNTLVKEDIKVWNELPDIYNERNLDIDKERIKVLNNLKSGVKKIYVSIPKKMIWEGVYTSYSVKVYYGHSYESVNSHSLGSDVRVIDLEKDDTKNIADKDVYSFTFDTLAENIENYFNVSFSENNTGSIEIANTYQIPPNKLVISQRVLNGNVVQRMGEFSFPNLTKNTYSIQLLETGGGQGKSVTITVDSSGKGGYYVGQTFQSFLAIGDYENSEAGKYLYGVPVYMSNASAEEFKNEYPEYKIYLNYNGTPTNYEPDEFICDIQGGFENCQLVLNYGTAVEYYSDFPVVLHDVGEFLSSDINLTIQLKIFDDGFEMGKNMGIYFNNELIDPGYSKTSSGNFSAYTFKKDTFPVDVTPPTLNKDGKEVTAFPELVYLKNNYDNGSGFTTINDAVTNINFPVCCSPWRNKWKSVADYSGSYGNDPGTEGINVLSTITKGQNKVDKVSLLIKNNMTLGKYIITTEGDGVPDCDSNRKKAALDYLYFKNPDGLAPDALKSVTYSVASGKLSASTESFTSNATVSQAIPLIENDGYLSWDYTKLTATGIDLPESFKNTFVKCGSKYEEQENGEKVPVYSMPKIYYYDYGNENSKHTFGPTVTKKNAQELDDNTVLLNSDQKYLVQTYISKEELSDETDWELFANTENPEILDDLNFYKVTVSSFEQDIYYRVIVHWADGTSTPCKVHFKKGNK